MPDFTPRAVCYRCHKPQTMCVCARVPKVDNRTSVFVLQHPRERLHPIGTARLADLGLSKVRVEVAWHAGVPEHGRPAWLPDDTALLYPAPAARDLLTLQASERPRHLLVLDGTWHTVSSLYRDKHWLRQLPHVRVSPVEPSRYRLRREPMHDYVSTIEAIVEALRVLEPETTGLDAMLGAFDAMIDDQLAHVLRRAGRPRSTPRRPKAQRLLPEALVTGLSRMVVAYVESACAGRHTPRELVQVTAHALATGATKQWHLMPSFGLPEPRLLEHMQLRPCDLVNASDIAAFGADWETFLFGCSAQPIVAAWNQSTFDLLQMAGATLPARLLLKSAYRGRCGLSYSDLDQVIAGENLSPAPSAMRGRAAWRVASAVAVARHLHALQYAPAPPQDGAHNPIADTR
jgi:DTW domain-containing protein YfiP